MHCIIQASILTVGTVTTCDASRACALVRQTIVSVVACTIHAWVAVTRVGNCVSHTHTHNIMNVIEIVAAQTLKVSPCIRDVRYDYLLSQLRPT